MRLLISLHLSLSLSLTHTHTHTLSLSQDALIVQHKLEKVKHVVRERPMIKPVFYYFSGGETWRTPRLTGSPA